MALLYMEGFDGYSDLYNIVRRPDVATGGSYNSNWISFQTGRINGSSIEFEYSASLHFLLPQPSTDLHWLNFALKFPDPPTTTTWVVLVADSAGSYIWSIYYNATSDKLEIRQGNTTVLATTSQTVPTTTWMSIGVEVYVHDTAGTVKVWVDGSLEIDLTSQDTKGGSTTSADKILLGYGITTAKDLRYDDFIFGDDSGTDLTSHPGDCHIEMLLPDGDGATNNWTPQGAGASYVEVDEATQDGDTTYVHSATATDKDLYTFANLTETANTVYAVQLSLYARKEGAGFREINHTMRSNVTEVDGPGTTLSTDYLWLVHHEENDPDGGGAWDEAAVNAVQAGVELKT